MQTNPRTHNINKHGSIVIQYEQNSVHMIGDQQLQKKIESIYIFGDPQYAAIHTDKLQYDWRSKIYTK